MRQKSRQENFYSLTGKFACLICFVLFFGIAFNLRAERLPIKTYTVADGLLRDNVYKIKQDSRGFLWFCTPEGVSRFDGYAFTNFTTEDGLPNRYVHDFLETRRGVIYLATGGGLARLNPTGIRAAQTEFSNQTNPLFSVILPDNPRAKKANVLFEDENGSIFAGTEDGLYKLNERDELELINLGKPLSGFDALPVLSIIKDRRGAMWIGTGSGLYRILPNGEVEHFTKENGLPDLNISILHEDKNGRIWVGLRPRFVSGLVLLVDEPKKNQLIVERFYTTKEGLPAEWITDLLEASDGRFWIATTRGVCRWQPEENSVCKTYTGANNLCDTEIWSLLEDKDGNFWMATRCGLKKWTRHGFTTFTEPDKTVSRRTNSIFENATGELFVSYNDGNSRVVSRFNGENFDLVKPNFPPDIIYFGWGSRQTVWQNAAGDWWFPTGSGLYRFPRPSRFEDLAQITPQKIEFASKGKEIFRFYEDKRGDFWIATTGAMNGLWRWERAADAWHDYTQAAGIGKSRLVLSFVEDRSGNLWIGTGSEEGDAALIRFNNNQFRTFKQTENELLAGWLNNLFVDGRNRIWIANASMGLLRLDDVNSENLDFTRYTPAEGLSSIAVSCVTEDEFGRIYVGTGRGLDRLNPETGQIENFTTADGLPNSLVEMAYRDRKNNLWFGTTSGVARFIPEPESQREPPKVFITGLRVSGVPQTVSILGESEIPPLELAADQQQVTVDFLGLATNLGERLKYEYRFGNADWTATNERTVNFANLKAGEYKFEVRAQTADRIYSQHAAVSFRIAAPLWQRWWFIALAAIFAGLAIYLIYRNRVARLLEIERTRTRIATDLHDDIGTNLSKISLLSEIVNLQLTNGDEKNRQMLASIAEISRESVSSMSDIVWAINPRRDSMSELISRMREYAEEIFIEKGARVSFNPPADGDEIKLSMNTRRDLFLIFKEAIANAVKHSDCRQVEIDFYIRRGTIFLQIRDDGRGFDLSEERDGNGLENMRRRAESNGGRFEVESKAGGGTRISIEFPQS